MTPTSPVVYASSMTALPDLSKLMPEARTQLALKIQGLKDFTLPELKYWNAEPCLEHAEVQTWCRRCGVIPLRHQRVGAAWLYARKKALLADSTGTGKTGNMALLIAILKEVGELDNGRVLVVCRAPAVSQWVQELNRMLPAIRTSGYQGTARQRLGIILTDWEVLVVGREVFNRDQKHGAFNNFDLTALLIDDVDSLRHRKNQISTSLKALANHVRYVVVANATPLGKHLKELRNTVDPIGGREVFGSETRFLNTYTVQEKVRIPVQGGRLMITKKHVAYQNIEQFKALLKPMVLRRTPADLDGSDMPAVVSSQVWLELHPAQRAKYKEIQEGVLKIIKSGKLADMKTIEALQIWMHAGACVTGLAALGEDDGVGTSSKLDWLMDKLDAELSEEKTLVFIHRINMLKAAQARLDAVGVKYVTISGLDSNPKRRAAAVQEFWDDPECKVMLGTSSLESSLNIQVARHLVCLDVIPNPSRMTQLAGRIARQGSRFSTVYVHTLMCVDTQEEALWSKLQLESALIDKIWDTESELFEQLPVEDLLRLIIS